MSQNIVYRQGPRGFPGDDGPPGPVGPPADVPPEITDMVGPFGTIVKSYDELVEALADGSKKIVFRQDIELEGGLYIPYTAHVEIYPFRLIQTAAHIVYFFGTTFRVRDQIFEDFLPGQIIGTFGEGEVWPEWWGLEGTDQFNGHHDTAINAALQANYQGSSHNNVMLDSRFYFVSKPIDLRGTKSRLKGVGQANTHIWGTTIFEPDSWEWSDIHQKILPTGICLVNSMSSGGLGRTIVETPNGGTTELFVGQMVTLSAASNPVYNGTWEVDSITDHNTVVLIMPFDNNATATLTPVTLDNQMETGAGSASSIIYMGGDYTNAVLSSMYMGVEGMFVMAYFVTVTHPLKRISCISWTGWVEEGTHIHDVICSGFSGFGIGGENSLGVTVINGLEISHFNMGGATRRGALAIYMAPHAGNVQIHNGTCNMVVGRPTTRAALTPPPYDYVYEWPQFAVLSQGLHVSLRNIHVEGVGNAFHSAWSGNGQGGMTIQDCDWIHGMDRGMVYWDESEAFHDWVPEYDVAQFLNDNLNYTFPHLFHWSCGISIGGLAGSYFAGAGTNQNVTVINCHTGGRVTYLLRDWCYNQHVHVYGDGQYLNAGTRAIGFYTRGIPYGQSLEVRFSAAATHSAGAKTILTVASSTDILAGQAVALKVELPIGAAKSNYEGPTFDPNYTHWVVDSVPDATHIVIDKPFTINVAGVLWRHPLAFHNGAQIAPPLTDKPAGYFLGPIT